MIKDGNVDLLTSLLVQCNNSLRADSDPSAVLSAVYSRIATHLNGLVDLPSHLKISATPTCFNILENDFKALIARSLK